jgi:hypothetical protein
VGSELGTVPPLQVTEYIALVAGLEVRGRAGLVAVKAPQLDRLLWVGRPAHRVAARDQRVEEAYLDT